MMPVQKPGKSKQDYGTPLELIAAIERRFGSLVWDLAASAENHKAPNWFDEAADSLSQDWGALFGRCWLNPPFAHIDPWAAKCRAASEKGAHILLLTPASIGTNWFAEHVNKRALVLGLSPRFAFQGCHLPSCVDPGCDGCSSYPKDCMLSCFGFGVGFDVWRWKP